MHSVCALLAAGGAGDDPLSGRVAFVAAAAARWDQRRRNFLTDSRFAISACAIARSQEGEVLASRGEPLRPEQERGAGQPARPLSLLGGRMSGRSCVHFLGAWFNLCA